VRLLLFFTLILYLLLPQWLQAIGLDITPTDLTAKERQNFKPWFTGSLLSGSGVTLPKGKINSEPYLFVTHFTGYYDSRWRSVAENRSVSVTPLLDTVYGLTDNMDMTIQPSLVANFQDKASDTRVEDFPLYLGFQILRGDPNTWKPDIRFLLKSIFPTGHYQHLNPSKNGTDSSGLGSYQMGFGLNIQKLFYLQAKKLLRVRWNFNYFILSKVHVEGFNTYGGGYGAKGIVYPGNFFSMNVAFEYTFTQNWIGALDINYARGGSTTFSGYPGLTSQGALSSMYSPRKQRISLAPAIEYAFTQNLGLIFGPWFTIAGKNSARFISYVVALNYVH